MLATCLNFYAHLKQREFNKYLTVKSQIETLKTLKFTLYKCLLKSKPREEPTWLPLNTINDVSNYGKTIPLVLIGLKESKHLNYTTNIHLLLLGLLVHQVKLSNYIHCI